MASREDYLRYAKECVDLAQRVAEPEQRMRLLEMAQMWRALAEKLDKPPEPDSR